MQVAKAITVIFLKNVFSKTHTMSGLFPTLTGCGQHDCYRILFYVFKGTVLIWGKQKECTLT